MVETEKGEWDSWNTKTGDIKCWGFFYFLFFIFWPGEDVKKNYCGFMVLWFVSVGCPFGQTL